MVVSRLDLRVLGGYIVKGSLPKVASEGQHVGLVDQGEVLLASHGQFERIADGPLHAVTRVDRSLGGDLERRSPSEESTLAGIGAFGVLAHHPEVDVVSRVYEGPEIHVEVQGKTHLQ